MPTLRQVGDDFQGGTVFKLTIEGDQLQMLYVPKELFELSKEDLGKEIRTAPQSSFHANELFQLFLMKEQAEQTKTMLNLTQEQAEQTKTMRRLTWLISFFTVVVTIATLLNLAISMKWIGN